MKETVGWNAVGTCDISMAYPEASRPTPKSRPNFAALSLCATVSVGIDAPVEGNAQVSELLVANVNPLGTTPDVIVLVCPAGGVTVYAAAEPPRA